MTLQETGHEVIAEAGGSVDETRVTLGFYGRDLDPAEISAALGCPPTTAHCRGEAPRRGPAYTQGAWRLQAEGKTPVTPDEIVQRLLGRLNIEPVSWEQLVATYTVRLTFGIFLGAWNRGFELCPSTVKRLAGLGIAIGFDIYADAGERSP